MGSEIVQRLRKYRPTDDWGQPCQHTICDEAADHIEALEAALKQCQSVLAMFIHPDTIMETTVLNAYTLATAAEAKARSLLPTTVPADDKPFTFADPARQAEWERQRKERGE
jgi:hypothetical protein